MNCLHHNLSFDHTNNIWLGIKVMKAPHYAVFSKCCDIKQKQIKRGQIAWVLSAVASPLV